MGIPPVRLQDEIPESVLQQVHEVLTSGMWIDGKNVKALEEEFAGYTGTKFCRAVSNGTAALLCALYAINLQPGDEVIIPSFSFIATANVVGHFKAKPVFIDIDETYNINPDLISEKLDADRVFGGDRPDIQDTTASGELSGFRDDVYRFVTNPDPLFGQVVYLYLLAGVDGMGILDEFPARQCAGHRRPHWGEDDGGSLRTRSVWYLTGCQLGQHQQAVPTCRDSPG